MVGMGTYHLLETGVLSEMENLVTHRLKEGWQLVGGICVVHYFTTSEPDKYTEENRQYFQAMLEP